MRCLWRWALRARGHSRCSTSLECRVLVCVGWAGVWYPSFSSSQLSPPLLSVDINKNRQLTTKQQGSSGAKETNFGWQWGAYGVSVWDSLWLSKDTWTQQLRVIQIRHFNRFRVVVWSLYIVIMNLKYPSVIFILMIIFWYFSIAETQDLNKEFMKYFTFMLF